MPVQGADDALVVGTTQGVYVAFESSGFSTWSKLGEGLPNVAVWELDYDPSDDLLLAGLLGRGAFTLRHPLIDPVIFEDDFETGTTAAWSGGSK